MRSTAEADQRRQGKKTKLRKEKQMDGGKDWMEGEYKDQEKVIKKVSEKEKSCSMFESGGLI